MSNVNFYNNTLYASLATAAFWCHACNNLVGEASNNIIQTAGATVNLTNDDSSSLGTGPFTFTTNDYTGTSTSFKQAGTTYATFALWQTGTGQEKISGVNVGLTVSPQLSSPGTAGTIGPPAPPAFSRITQYMFKRGWHKADAERRAQRCHAIPEQQYPNIQRGLLRQRHPNRIGHRLPSRRERDLNALARGAGVLPCRRRWTSSGPP